MDTTVLAARLFRFKWAFQASGNCVCHELGTLGTHLTFAKSFREEERMFLHTHMPADAVDLHKLGDKSDILLLLFQKRFHSLIMHRLSPIIHDPGQF